MFLTPAKPNLAFFARASSSVTRMSSFLLRMSSSSAMQYDTADSRVAKLSSPCWKVLLRTAECVRTSLRMERVLINLWDVVCFSRPQTVTSSSEELKYLKVLLEVHSLTDILLSQLRVIGTHYCQFLVLGRDLPTEESRGICYRFLVST